MEGFSSTKEMTENRLSIQEAKEIFKTARQVLQWPRKLQNWLGLWLQK